MTLPLPLRNRLADLILDALDDGEARRALEAVAVASRPGRGIDGPLPVGFPIEMFDRARGGLRLKSGWRQYAEEFAERAERAWRLLDRRPLDPSEAPLAIGLAQAALLFDARLYFEVHELLEPYWMRAEGRDREAIQGLIQASVGLEHLVNGNVAGARSLLRDGVDKLGGRGLEGIALDGLAQGLAACLEEVTRLGADAPARFAWAAVPRFPTRSR